MSIRIHELAKKIGMDNKQLLALLKERKYDVKSVSSTIDNISAEAIEQEFATQASNEPAPETEVVANAGAETAEAEASSGGFTLKAPTGVFVKTKEDVRREKEEAAKAALAAKAPPPPPPAPVAPAPPPPRVVQAPPPPPPLQRPLTPPPLAKPPPLVTPSALRSPGIVTPPPAPRPHVAAPVVPPPVSKPVAAPVAPPAPPPLARPVPPPAAPLPPPKPPLVAPPAAPALPVPSMPITITEQGDVKIIQLKPPVVVRDFAAALGLRPFQLISELMQMGIFASVTQALDEAIAAKVAEKHGFLLEVKHRADAATQQAAKERAREKKPEEDESKFLQPRPAVVCILGHVDHGKTSLLDAIRQANVAAGETGGITQHIGAYQIEFQNRKITFLDTPGHAAFIKMRARGASVTDIAVLVVAADDGFMPQTDEALKHAQNAKVALIVAINKIDVKGANLDQVKSQMQQRNIAPEDWGGETITVPVSAIKKQGISDLLEMILLQADVLELKANPKAEASGSVIESQIEVGRGSTATVIVQRGTLRVGDAVVCGPYFTRVKALFDDQGRQLKEAPPSTPVKIIGWSGTPDCGAAFRVVKNAREAEQLAEQEALRIKKEAVVAAAVPKEVSVEKLFADIAATQQRTLKVVVKTDVFGSSEAVRNILEGIRSSKVQLEILSTDVGLVTKNDVLMASAAGAIILGFNTKLENGVTPLAKHHGVRIETFGIIYELGDKVREIMADLLEPELKEVKSGAAEVRAIFPLAKGFVAGCLVTEGKIVRNASARLRRGRQIVHEGKVGTLKRFKDDANEVRAGLECGIKLDDFNGYQVGDVIECYEIQKVRASL